MSSEHTPKCGWKYCPGWTIDWLGFVRPCGQCNRFAPDEEDAAATAAGKFIESFDVLPGEGAPEPCSSGCRGWHIFHRSGSEMPGFDIERCDDCGLFEDDDEALAAAVKWLLEHLIHPEKYLKKKDVGIGFDEMVGRTIRQLERGTTEGAHGDEPTVTLHFTDGTRHTLVLAHDGVSVGLVPSADLLIYLVEYDETYRGGDYHGAGITVRIACSSDDAVPAAFSTQTGVAPVHIVHYRRAEEEEGAG